MNLLSEKVIKLVVKAQLGILELFWTIAKQKTDIFHSVHAFFGPFGPRNTPKMTRFLPENTLFRSFFGFQAHGNRVGHPWGACGVHPPSLWTTSDLVWAKIWSKTDSFSPLRSSQIFKSNLPVKFLVKFHAFLVKNGLVFAYSEVSNHLESDLFDLQHRSDPQGPSMSSLDHFGPIGGLREHSLTFWSTSSLVKIFLRDQNLRFWSPLRK